MAQIRDVRFPVAFGRIALIAFALLWSFWPSRADLATVTPGRVDVHGIDSVAIALASEFVWIWLALAAIALLRLPKVPVKLRTKNRKTHKCNGDCQLFFPIQWQTMAATRPIRTSQFSCPAVGSRQWSSWRSAS